MPEIANTEFISGKFSAVHPAILLTVHKDRAKILFIIDLQKINCY
jgi:hypothetical protein